MRKYELKRKMIDDKYMCLKVSFAYGGMNYANYKRESKGIYLHFTEEVIKQEDGYSTRSFEPFNNKNFKILIEELPRKSTKKVEKAFERIELIQDDLFNAYSEDDKQKCFELIRGE